MNGQVGAPLDPPLPASRRFAPMLEDLLRDTATRTERILSWMRASLCVLVALNLVVLSHETTGSSWSMALRLFGMAISFVVSMGIVLRLRRQPVTRALQYVATVFDPLVIAMSLAPHVLMPELGYPGFLHLPHWALLLLTLTASGLRLSTAVAALSSASTLTLFGLLVLLDARLNAPTTWSAYELGLSISVLLGASFVALAIAHRTRRIVYDGAFAMVEAEKARQHLGVYISEAIATEALKSDDLQLGGRRMEVAVLFSDLRGFTRYAEKLPPERLVSELNEYLDDMVAVVVRHGGVVDKFIGDAVMAVFGIPSPRGDEAARALRAADGMRAALCRHNERRIERGLPPLRQGIGVHFGPVVAGNVGTRERLQYTVLGDTVNLASRLESATKDLDVDVIASDDIVRTARAGPGADDLPTIESAGALKVRGREAPLQVWVLALEQASPSGAVGTNKP